MSENEPVGLVAIGASAGGIEAFRQFFKAMPADTGLAFVVVLHLAAHRKSMLPEILARWTSMPVAEATNGAAIVADHVLVLPAGAVAELRDGRLLLHKTAADASRSITPIDAFFDTVATGMSENAIGIILSGTGHDGSLGLKAIKARGGLTLAQGGDGPGPEYSDMPESAVAAGAVDLYVRVEEMPERILAARRVQATQFSAGNSVPDESVIQASISDILRARLGHDFADYKRHTFIRRVMRRMQVTQFTQFVDYISFLQTDRSEAALLLRDLLISVTSFFRDPETFASLANDIVPRMFRGKDASSDLRVWVPGCATGEEAYSLAILLREHMDTLSTCPKVHVFASDIDEIAIGTARAGRYPATLLEGMSPQRLSRFFAAGTDGFSVRQEIRELCTFSAHSLIRDPPFSRIDLISCRNLLIYLNAELQDRVFLTFHYALAPNGVLILGSSETVSRQANLFHTLDRRHRIYTRGSGQSDISSVYQLAQGGARPGVETGRAKPPNTKTNLSKAVASANRRVLERFAAPFVVVSAAGEIVHFSSNIGRYLEPAAGVPTANLFQMARRGWALELRMALRRGVEAGRAVEHVHTVVAGDGERTYPVKLIVEPIPGSDSETLYMIIFVDMDSPRPAGDQTQSATLTASNAAVADLDRENRDLREQLQSIAEEHATAIEELRSSNEELQSVNEELQSTNEELETSREEIQSINEELNTVNVQLSAKVEELDHHNSDLKNLFESTKVATVFLDTFLIIRSFTPEIASIYNLIPSDVGRPLTDIISQLSYNDLRGDVQAVLGSLQPLEKRVQCRDGSTHYLMRILPYRLPDSTVDGSLITFVDVTSIVRAEEHQRLLVDELNHRVKNMLTVVISLATNTLRQSASLEAFKDVFLGRIHALTAAYTLLSRDAWSAVPLREILMQELHPFLAGEPVTVTVNGPAVLVGPRVALAMGMAIHELTTNAVKYGSLSVPEGKVDVAWAVAENPAGRQLVLQWTERNGPKVVKPVRHGFGMMLVERAFAHDVGGQADVEFQPEGVVAILRAPLADTHKETR